MRTKASNDGLVKSFLFDSLVSKNQIIREDENILPISARRFNGVDDYLVHDTDVDLRNDFSFCFWLFPQKKRT